MNDLQLVLELIDGHECGGWDGRRRFRTSVEPEALGVPASSPS